MNLRTLFILLGHANILCISKAFPNPLEHVKVDIRNSFDNWTTAWNNDDIEGYLNGYANLPSVRYVSGKKIIKGKENIENLFRERGAKGTLSLVHFESECVSESDAVCFGQYRLTCDDDKHEGCFTVHVRKIEGSWKIISDHSS